MSVDSLLKGEYGVTRLRPVLSNEWGRRAQGNDTEVEYTNMIEFISFDKVPLY